MRIGCVDVDGHNFPNLALMKLATYHKQRGDEVEWAYTNALNVALRCRVMNTMIFVHGVDTK